LDVADVQVIEKGLLVSVRRSKTDQEADGAVVAIPRGIHHCPVEALQSWLQAGCIAGGPLFRAVDKAGRVCAARLSDRAVTTIVKRYAGQIGLDAKTFSAHSLRSGFLTSAAANGASIFKMMDVSRHKSIDTLRSYVRDAELFVNHAGGGLL
jgi:integrase